MPQPPTIFPKLHVSSRLPESLSAPTTAVPFPNFGPTHVADTNPHQPLYRTKRKHVLKACDRCRVKKTKCDGNQPCYRCAVYNHPCLFRERKATQTKAYSRGFVEMLESHHALVVKALQQLYTHCINNKCFPGEPIDVVDGYPLTHAILDRLGLIKEAEEENSTAKPEGGILNTAQYWKRDVRISNSPDGDDSPLEQPCSLERSPSSDSPSVSTPSESGFIKCERSPIGVNEAYGIYPREEQFWPTVGDTTAPQVIGFNPGVTAGYSVAGPTNVADRSSCDSSVPFRNPQTMVPGTYAQPACQGIYSSFPAVYESYTNTFSGTEQQGSWNHQPWSG